MLLALTLLPWWLSGCLVTPMPDEWLAAGLPEQVPAEPFVPHRFVLQDDTQVVGRLYYTRVQAEQTLLDIARAYGLGYEEIRSANPGVDPWTPVTGERVLLPLAHVLPDAPREGIVINLAARRLFHYMPGESGAPTEVVTHPIGIGREGWSTPLGQFRITERREGPAWTVPASIRREHAARDDPLPAVVPPGPDNPLGSHALRLDWSSILIHGTNKPAGIGMRVSHGCIQLYPEDIEALFAAAPEGTRVWVVDQPWLAGFGAEGLVLEAHPPASAAGAKVRARTLLERALQQSAEPIPLDWQRIRELSAERPGYPLPVAVGAPHRDTWLADLPEAPLLEPPAATPGPGGEWFVDLGQFEHERAARRLVAMLRFQGPAIPAFRQPRDEKFQVLAGPWPTRVEAAAAARRIARDLEQEGRVVQLREAEFSARL